MAFVKYQSRTRECGMDGTSVSVIHCGTREEMVQLQRENPVGAYTQDGQLKSSRIFQGDGSLWQCEFRYASDADGGEACVAEPDTAYGKKSAQLQGSMLACSLETHLKYRTNWNYFLATRPDNTSSGVPVWYDDATDTILSVEDAEHFAWIKTPGELPSDKAGRWRILRDPVKPGRDTFDVATYVVTESVRCRSSAEAGRLCANKLNKIGTPYENFGISGGNWKCDNVSVSWAGKYWLATLTWTRSGDAAGWDEDLYTGA